MTTLQRAWRGGKNDWKLHVLGIFSVAVAFLCLAAALLVVVNVEGLRDAWARAGRASVYVQPGTDPAAIAEIERALEVSPGVRSARFVSSDGAREELVGSSADPLLAKLPKEAFPASIEVTLDDDLDSSRLRALSSTLSALPAVEAVETYEAWTTRLGSVLAAAVTAALLLAAVVLAAVVSVVASTIRLTLQRRRMEVEVLKLVGATDEYVRRPFVIEGAAQGSIGALAAIVLLGVLFSIVRSHFDARLVQLVGATPQFLPWALVAAMIGCGALLGTLAAYASLRRLLSI